MRKIQTGDLKFESKRFWLSMMVPTIFIVILWLLALIQNQLVPELNSYGIVPLTGRGLIGILTSPFLHADFKHLWSNTIPLWVLLSALFYYYPKVAWQTLLIIWMSGGLFVWLFGREGNHIGASGLVYGLASFHFVQGILQRNSSLLAFMFLEIFLFGGMIWGIFPEFFPKENISWESHLFGLLVGIVLAFVYRHDGPPIILQSWELEPEEEESEDVNSELNSDISEEKQHNQESQSQEEGDKKRENEHEVRFIYHKNSDIKK